MHLEGVFLVLQFSFLFVGVFPVKLLLLVKEVIFFDEFKLRLELKHKVHMR